MQVRDEVVRARLFQGEGCTLGGVGDPEEASSAAGHTLQCEPGEVCGFVGGR